MVHRILVVEDEAPIALAIQTMMERAFHACDVQLAQDGEAAWHALQAQACDLVIADWNMPRATGCDLLQLMRSHPTLDAVPFIMVTARTDRESVYAAVDAGANDYLCKPFDRDVLVEKARRLLPQQPSSSATGESDLLARASRRLQEMGLQFPPIPGVSGRVVHAALQARHCDQLMACLRDEPSLAGRVMAASHQAGGCHGRQSLDDAVHCFGLRGVQTVLQALHAEDVRHAPAHLDHAVMHGAWLHTLAVAHAAEALASCVGVPHPDTAYTAGLLHDIGLWPVLHALGQQVVADPRQMELALRCLHVSAGAEVLSAWGVPDWMGGAIRQVHLPLIADAGYEQLMLVAAEGVAVEMGYGLSVGEHTHAADDWVFLMDLTTEDVHEVQEHVAQAMRQVKMRWLDA